jgi:tRNA(Ile)-lysidine synthase
MRPSPSSPVLTRYNNPTTTMTISAAVWNTWQAGGVPPDAPLVVGVSGGVDSLALLHWLAHAGAHPRHLLTAVYIHHGTRPEADAEAEWVQQMAAEWHIPSRVVRVAVPEGTGSWEGAARQMRYRALGQVAAELGGHLVATAHHADDQAETVLLHLLRGSGLAGLRGMRPEGDLPEWGAPYRVVRPFLTLWRTQIEAYSAEQGLRPVQDPSNQDPHFARNRIRHELLPLLHANYNAQAAAHLVQTAALLAADYEVVQAAVDKAWHTLAETGAGVVAMPLAGWLAQPLAVRRELLRRAVATLAGTTQDLSFAILEEARLLLEQQTANKQAKLPRNICAELQYNGGHRQVLVWRGEAAVLAQWLARGAPQLATLHPHPLAVPGEVALANGWRLTAELLVSQPSLPSDDPWQVVIPLRAGAQLWVRPRQAGERMHPLGGAGTAKLKKLMNAAHIPSPLRDFWPLVADEQGVLWLVGHWRAQRTAEASQPLILLKVLSPEC